MARGEGRCLIPEVSAGRRAAVPGWGLGIRKCSCGWAEGVKGWGWVGRKTASWGGGCEGELSKLPQPRPCALPCHMALD